MLEYAKLLREEGVENIELTRKYIRPLYPNYNKIKRSWQRYSFREAVDFNASSGNIRKACEWAEKAPEMTATYVGIDYEGYKDD